MQNDPLISEHIAQQNLVFALHVHHTRRVARVRTLRGRLTLQETFRIMRHNESVRTGSLLERNLCIHLIQSGFAHTHRAVVHLKEPIHGQLIHPFGRLPVDIAHMRRFARVPFTHSAVMHGDDGAHAVLLFQWRVLSASFEGFVIYARHPFRSVVLIIVLRIGGIFQIANINVIKRD